MFSIIYIACPGKQIYKSTMQTHVSDGVVAKTARLQQTGTEVVPTASGDLKYISIYLVEIIE